jgi:hypothetical protein
MSAEPLTGSAAVLFDAHGTVFEVHAPMARLAGRRPFRLRG